MGLLGRVHDFHSLRHGFIRYLVTTNVPPKIAQTLAAALRQFWWSNFGLFARECFQKGDQVRCLI